MLTYADVCRASVPDVPDRFSALLIVSKLAYVSIRQHTSAYAYVSIREPDRFSALLIVSKLALFYDSHAATNVSAY